MKDVGNGKDFQSTVRAAQDDPRRVATPRVWLRLDRTMAGLFFLLVISSYVTRYYPRMPYPTKVQLIQRKQSEQWYINFPAAIAQAMDFAKGEEVLWTIADKGNLILSRKQVPPNPIDLKKTLRSSKH